MYLSISKYLEKGHVRTKEGCQPEITKSANISSAVFLLRTAVTVNDMYKEGQLRGIERKNIW